MWRYIAGAGAVAALLAAAFVVVVQGDTTRTQDPAIPSAPAPRSEAEPVNLPYRVPAATDATREERRFSRYDKDRDGAVTREEYVAQRRKAYARLDRNGDGQLSFDEWAIKATTKFAGADRDKSGSMSPREFATTAVSRKPARPCAPQRPAAQADEEG
jgi:hypothetical protein